MANPTKIEKAKTQLIVRHPFFASILLRRNLVETTNIPTAGIDKSGTIYYNPEFVNGLTINNVVFLLAHEVMHWAQATFARQGSRDFQKWNKATDAVNNEVLVASNVGEFIEGGVRWSGAEQMSAEEVYNLMPDDNANGGIGDDLMDSGEPMSEAEAKAQEAQIKTEVASARQAAKQIGSLPGALDRWVDGLLHVPTPWHQILERWMTERTRDDYSWSRANRRFIHSGLYLPSMDGTGLESCALVVDTSASISPQELDAFLGHLNRILETCQPHKVYVVYVDAKVSDVETVSGDDLPVTINPKGGGGTDMRVGVEYVDTNLSDVSCQILLTDGYTPWPQRAPSVPLVVVSTSDQVCSTPGVETLKVVVD
jgi:predicted metal-dependent peptidase